MLTAALWLGVAHSSGHQLVNAKPRTSGTAFSFEGRRTRFGHSGLRLHLSVAGPSTRTAPSPPSAFFDVAGDLTVVA